MSRPVKVVLMGKAFTLQTDEDEAHVRRVAALVDERLNALQTRTAMPPQSLALLAALTIADDLEKERARNAQFQGQVRERTVRLRDRLRAASQSGAASAKVVASEA